MAGNLWHGWGPREIEPRGIAAPARPERGAREHARAGTPAPRSGVHAGGPRCRGRELVSLQLSKRAHAERAVPLLRARAGGSPAPRAGGAGHSPAPDDPAGVFSGWVSRGG